MSGMTCLNICLNTCFVYYLQELSTDASQHVRAALASVIMGLAPVLGKVNPQASRSLPSARAFCPQQGL